MLKIKTKIFCFIIIIGFFSSNFFYLLPGQSFLSIVIAEQEEKKQLPSLSNQEEISTFLEGLEKKWFRISERIKDFWNYTILPKFQIRSQSRNSWIRQIKLFLERQYQERKMTIQKELKEEKKELRQLTPPIIIEIWQILTEIRPIIIKTWERLKNFYSNLRNINIENINIKE